MNREVRFTLEEAEMLEYYAYVFAMTPQNKARAIWLKGSIPLLIALTLYFFHLYSVVWVDVLALTLSLVWLFVLSGKLYSRSIAAQTAAWFSKNVKTASFSEVSVSFKEEIMVDKKRFAYSELRRVVPLRHVLVFYCGNNEVFLIPKRVIGDEAQMSVFSQELIRAKKGRS